MMQGHEPDRVLAMRRDFQRMMKERYSEMIEQLTGRKVLAFLSQAHVEPDLTIEIFLMDGPLATSWLRRTRARRPTAEQPRRRREPAAGSYERRTGGRLRVNRDQRTAQFSMRSSGVVISVNDSAAGKLRGSGARLPAERMLAPD